MTAVNTWKLPDWHQILNPPNSKENTKITIQKFAGALCYQLVTNTSAFVSFSLLQLRLLSEVSLSAISSISTQDTSNVIKSSAECQENHPITIRLIKDNNGHLHHQVHYPVNGWKWKTEHIDTRRQIVQGKGAEKTYCRPLLLHLRWIICILLPK